MYECVVDEPFLSSLTLIEYEGVAEDPYRCGAPVKKWSELGCLGQRRVCVAGSVGEGSVSQGLLEKGLSFVSCQEEKVMERVTCPRMKGAEVW